MFIAIVSLATLSVAATRYLSIGAAVSQVEVVKLVVTITYFCAISSISSTLLRATDGACIKVFGVGGTETTSRFLV